MEEFEDLEYLRDRISARKKVLLREYDREVSSGHMEGAARYLAACSELNKVIAIIETMMVGDYE